MLTINNTIDSTTLPHVAANTIKGSNFFVCSLSINSWISLIFTLARFKSSTKDKIYVSGSCNGISCSCSPSCSVRQQRMSTGANGNTSSCELFRTKVDKAYKVLWVKYPLHRGAKYSTTSHDFVMSTGTSQIHTIQWIFQFQEQHTAIHCWSVKVSNRYRYVIDLTTFVHIPG